METTTTKTPKSNVKVFGKEYCFQGVFASKELMDASIKVWKDAGHSTMQIPKTSLNLYVTRFKTRNW